MLRSENPSQVPLKMNSLPWSRLEIMDIFVVFYSLVRLLVLTFVASLLKTVTLGAKLPALGGSCPALKSIMLR